MEDEGSDVFSMSWRSRRCTCRLCVVEMMRMLQSRVDWNSWVWAMGLLVVNENDGGGVGDGAICLVWFCLCLVIVFCISTPRVCCLGSSFCFYFSFCFCLWKCQVCRWAIVRVCMWKWELFWQYSCEINFHVICSTFVDKFWS